MKRAIAILLLAISGAWGQSYNGSGVYPASATTIAPGTNLNNPSLGLGYLSDTAVAAAAVPAGDLVCYTTYAGQVALQTCPTNGVGGASGVAITAAAGAGATFEVASYGVVTPTTDAGGGTAQNIFVTSTTVAGRAKDLGTTTLGGIDVSGGWAGVFLASCAASTPCPALVFGPYHRGSAINLSTSTALSGQLPPLLGGVGAMSGAPSMMRYLGNGSDGPINCNGTLGGGDFNATTFTVSLGNTCSYGQGFRIGTVIHATGACTIAGAMTNIQTSNTGDMGGSGGGGGGGTGVGSVGTASQANSLASNGMSAGGVAGTSSGGAGGTASVTLLAMQKLGLWMGTINRGGSQGGAGGSSGPAGAFGGQSLILICNSINFTGTINGTGANGASSTANTMGAGGGGGGAVVVLSSPTYTANTGQIAIQGGQGGGCINPAIIFSIPIANGTVSASTNASPSSLTLTGSSNLPSGATITIAGATGNWTPINGARVVTAVDATHFTIPVDSTAFGALTGTMTWTWNTMPAGVSSGLGAVAHVSGYAGGVPNAITVDAAGSGYNFTPACSIVGTGGGGNTGAGAACTVTMAGVSPNMTVSSIATIGGTGYGSGTTYTTCGRGGDGAPGWSMTLTPQ